MPDQPSLADPIAALLALEIPDDYRETMAVLRTYAELALAETRGGVRRGPAMARHMSEGLGHPDAAIMFVDLLDQLVASVPARKEEAKAIALLNEHGPKVAKFVETVKAFINERPGVIQAINECAPGNDSDYWRWQGHAEARRVLAEALNLTVPQKIGETTGPKVDTDA